MSERNRPATAGEIEPPVSVSHIFHVLRAYFPVIGLSMAVVIIGYAIIGVAVYVLSPSQLVITQPFRLEFTGADKGTYPNGAKFSSTEIISTPILLKVYQQNELARFTPFSPFASSVFVLKTNAAQEALAREYQARLSDLKLTPVDRDRLQQEYEAKVSSLSKDQYSLNFVPSKETNAIPDVVVRKVLQDILREWAKFVTTEQHVQEYRLAVVSQASIASIDIADDDPIVATLMLRSKLNQIQSNINALREVPNAELIRTKREGLSLVEIETRLGDIVRFRLEPLVQHIAASRTLSDRRATLQFLETQMAFDERQLASQEEKADAARKALEVYVTGSTTDRAARLTEGPEARPERLVPSETVIPTMSESFIERLIRLTASSSDMEYRQHLANDYHDAIVALGPLRQAVAYDKTTLDLVRGAAAGTNSLTREQIGQRLTETRREVGTLVESVHEIYQFVSQNLNPSTELLTIGAMPKTRVERSASLRQIALYGLLTCFIAFPVIVIFALLHNRIREEDQGDTRPAEQVPHAG
jgi:hypothetical protein